MWFTESLLWRLKAELEMVALKVGNRRWTALRGAHGTAGLLGMVKGLCSWLFMTGERCRWSLVNIHQHTGLQIVCLVMRTFKIGSLSNFQACNTILLTIVAMLYVTSRGLIYAISGSLYLLRTVTPFSPVPCCFVIFHNILQYNLLPLISSSS